MGVKDILLILAIAAVIVCGFIWRNSRKKKGKGCAGCSGDCSSCSKY